MDARVTELDARGPAMDARVTSMDERVPAMDARVPAIYVQVPAINSQGFIQPCSKEAIKNKAVWTPLRLGMNTTHRALRATSH